MPCYHPIPAWYGRRNAETGKSRLVFGPEEGYNESCYAEVKLQVPCGTCIGCRLERARDWAVRCTHEIKCWPSNLFVTFTYENSKIPVDGSLRPADMVNFLKKLRDRQPGVRFFQCGEYGDLTERPHHHALLFNCSFPDMREHKKSGGHQLFLSDSLEKLWGFGNCPIGTATYASAGYIAKYTVKSFKDSPLELHEWLRGRVSPYLTMSRRPGIGSLWCRKYWRDWYPSDTVMVNGSPRKPPRFYDEMVKKLAPEVWRRVLRQRVYSADRSPDNTGKRLLVKEAVKEACTEFFVSRDQEI